MTQKTKNLDILKHRIVHVRQGGFRSLADEPNMLVIRFGEVSGIVEQAIELGITNQFSLAAAGWTGQLGQSNAQNLERTVAHIEHAVQSLG